MQHNIVLRIITKINQNIIQNKINIYSDKFFLDIQSNGNDCIVTFLGITIWNSNDDTRKIINNDYEPLKEFLLDQIKDITSVAKIMWETL